MISYRIRLARNVVRRREGQPMPHSSNRGCFKTPMSEISLDLTSTSSDDDGYEEWKLAQKEWEESLQQLQNLILIVVMPYFGKYMGRRWGYWRTFYQTAFLNKTRR